MFYTIVVAFVIAVVSIVLDNYPDKKAKIVSWLKDLFRWAAVCTALVAVAILFGTVLYGALAEEVTDAEGLRAHVVEVDIENGLVAVETEDGEIYRYKATGKIDAFRVRIALDAEKVARVEAETKVKATLVGFNLANGTFKLLTSTGDVEEFYLENGSYSINDTYYIYYADGFAPVCRPIT